MRRINVNARDRQLCIDVDATIVSGLSMPQNEWIFRRLNGLLSDQKLIQIGLYQSDAVSITFMDVDTFFLFLSLSLSLS